MTDDRKPSELHPNRDPSGTPPLPDGHWVRASRPPDPSPLTTRQKLTAVLVVVIVVAAVVIGVLR